MGIISYLTAERVAERVAAEAVETGMLILPGELSQLSALIETALEHYQETAYDDVFRRVAEQIEKFKLQDATMPLLMIQAENLVRSGRLVLKKGDLALAQSHLLEAAAALVIILGSEKGQTQ